MIKVQHVEIYGCSKNNIKEVKRGTKIIAVSEDASTFAHVIAISEETRSNLSTTNIDINIDAQKDPQSTNNFAS